jgi:hypothetical protein
MRPGNGIVRGEEGNEPNEEKHRNEAHDYRSKGPGLLPEPAVIDHHQECTCEEGTEDRRQHDRADRIQLVSRHRGGCFSCVKSLM